MYRLIVIALFAGCTPSLSAGYDTHTRLTGPVANMVTQPAATARQDSASVAPISDTRSYSFAVGGSFGRKARMGFEVGAHLHEINGSSFSLPTATGVDPTSPRYLFATTSLDVRFRPLALRYIAADIHVGPAAGMVVDRGLLGHEFGNGYRLGVMVAGKLGPLNAFADLYQTEMAFNDGAAKGVSKLSGLTIGIALR